MSQQEEVLYIEDEELNNIEDEIFEQEGEVKNGI